MQQDEKLDRFMPDANTVAAVKRQLVNAGVEPNAIPMDWLVAIVAGTTKWISQTPEGMSFAVNNLKFKWTQGKDEFQYDYHDYETGQIYRLKPKQIHFFAGAAVNGKPIDPHSIVASKATTEQCEGCGIVSHCTKTARNPSTDKMVTLCNACLSQDEHPRIREEGDPKMCDSCSIMNCCHHPKALKQMRA